MEQALAGMLLRTNTSSTSASQLRLASVSHPTGGRVRDRPVPDTERELKSLKI